MPDTERHLGCVRGYLYTVGRCIADWCNKELNAQKLGRENRRDFQAKRGTRDESRCTEEMPGDTLETLETGWVACGRRR